MRGKLGKKDNKPSEKAESALSVDRDLKEGPSAVQCRAGRRQARVVVGRAEWRRSGGGRGGVDEVDTRGKSDSYQGLSAVHRTEQASLLLGNIWERGTVASGPPVMS